MLEHPVAYLGKSKYNNIQAHQSLPHPRTGQTTFSIIPQHVNKMSNYQVSNNCSDSIIHGHEIQLALHLEEIETCMRQEIPEQIAFLASAAKRQRAEVKEKELSKK